VLGLGVNVLRKALEKSRLLATGNKHVTAGAQVLGGNTHFVAAQLIHCDDLIRGRGFAQGL
jgi:hypothetical protein